MEFIKINTNYNSLGATIFKASHTNKVLVIACATGVKQRFYQKFAMYLASQGITTITFDYSGIGESLDRPLKKITSNAIHWGKIDLEAVIEYTLKQFPKSELFLLGHSLGGQLIGFSKSSLKAKKIILIASQSGNWRFWPGFHKYKMAFNWYALFPALTALFGYLPSKKISAMENLPKSMSMQWSNWCKHKNYFFSDKSVKKIFFTNYKNDVTSFYSIPDKFAPEKAIFWLNKQFSNTSVKTIKLNSENDKNGNIGHFGFFKEKFKDNIWVKILNEMK